MIWMSTKKNKIEDVSIVRVEQLSPFPLIRFLKLYIPIKILKN